MSRSANLVRLVATAVATAVLTAGATLLAAPSYAANSFLTIAADTNQAFTGEEVHFVATTDYDLSRYVLRVEHLSEGVYYDCAALPCTWSKTQSVAGTYYYRVLIVDSRGVVEMAEITVRWQAPYTNCRDVPDPVEVCVTLSSTHSAYAAYDEAVLIAPSEIGGYVDQYRFTAGVTFTIACAVLVRDGGEVNPCKTAGGTFVTRMATLVDAYSEQNPPVSALARVRLCNATLSATVAGLGVNSAAILTTC